jgi:Uma2 family endonuclease
MTMTALRNRDTIDPADGMTIAEFLAFVATRPNEERWELIEGIATMNAAPTDWHQMICSNINNALLERCKADGAMWRPIFGIGTIVPNAPTSLPQPDLQVLERGLGAIPSSTTSDSIVLFEVLSKSNTKLDQAWRKRVYASIPNLQHYVTVSQRSAVVMRFDRADGWVGTEFKGLGAQLLLPALGKGVGLALKDVYWSTSIK